MKKHYVTIIALTLTLLSPQAAYAADRNHSEVIDGDALQEKAEQILKSAPDAKQVTVRVEVEAKAPPKEHTVNFDGFDLNSDGILSRDEVGEKLFKIFDRDGNEVIDNIEMKQPNLIVFTQMESKMIEIIDYKTTSTPTKRNVTRAQFLRESKLSRFDKNADGLSPLDFLEKPFNQVNVKDDAVIDLYEWKRAYAQTVKPAHMEDYNYNN